MVIMEYVEFFRWLQTSTQNANRRTQSQGAPLFRKAQGMHVQISAVFNDYEDEKEAFSDSSDGRLTDFTPLDEVGDGPKASYPPPPPRKFQVIEAQRQQQNLANSEYNDAELSSRADSSNREFDHDYNMGGNSKPTYTALVNESEAFQSISSEERDREAFESSSSFGLSTHGSEDDHDPVDDLNPDITASQLPRTLTREYNVLEPGRKYFIYSPSGGWNNQLACLLNALVLAKMSGRDLIVPPMARHSDMFTGYLKVQARGTTPMDTVVDLDYLEQSSGVRILAMNLTLEQFANQVLEPSITKIVTVPRGETLIRPTNKLLYSKVEGWIKKAPEKVVYYRGPFFSRHWADWEIGSPKAEVWKHLQYAPYLQAIAQQVQDTLFPEGYNALHIRMGDYLARLQGRAGDGSRQWVKAVKTLGWAPERALYVASDMPGTSTHFTNLRSFANHSYFMADVEARGILNEFKELVPHPKLQSDIFGLVEQLICVDANNWIGSYFSTFSLTINMMRDNDENSRLMTSFGGLRRRHKPSANT